MNTISREVICEAHNRIMPHIHKTAVLQSQLINQIADCELFFKCENFQKAGAFKSRGAVNAIFSLSEETAACGVATHSSGNHAGALARAAHIRGIPAYIVMPENAPKVKVAAVKSYGGQIFFCKPTLQAREDRLQEVVEKYGAHVVHPYDDNRVIAGQATACKELLEEVEDLEVVMAPVGGGGLLSGTALSVNYFGNNQQVIAAEPSGADDAYRSFEAKKFIPSQNPITIADGLLTSLGKLTFPIILSEVDAILLVDEDEILAAMRLIWERMKILIEPSSAVPLAAVLKNRERFKGKRVGIILSGGNLDLTTLKFQ